MIGKRQFSNSGVFMGFFSRIFNFDEKKAATSSALAPDPGSEFGLDAKSADAILAEIDVDSAIAAHENWKLRLKNYLDGKSTELFDPSIVCMDDRCDLGKWLHGPGGQRLGKYPAFSVLIARHKYFHTQASTVVALTQSGDMVAADKALEGSFRHASNQVVLLLKELKRGLGR
jgi:hypothetical protein